MPCEVVDVIVHIVLDVEECGAHHHELHFVVVKDCLEKVAIG
jgi:hypothetical protein